MIRLVKRGANQIVHGGVGNHEGFCAVALHVQHAGHKCAGLRHQETSWLEQQAARKAPRALFNGAAYSRNFGRGDRNRHRGNRCPARRRRRSRSVHAGALQLPHKFCHPLHRGAKRICGANLRADMHAHAVRFEPAIPRGIPCRCAERCEYRCRICARAVRWRCRDASRQRHRDSRASAKRALVLSLRARAARSSSSASLSTLNSRILRAKSLVDLCRRFADAGKHDAGPQPRVRREAHAPVRRRKQYQNPRPVPPAA